MKRSLRLSLKKETLSLLTGDDMRAVGGGAADTSAGTCFTCIDCILDTIAFRSLNVTGCCQGIPTFHRAGAAC